MATGTTLLHLPSGPTGLVAKLHPTVLFNICDSYIRRNDQQERVIGTLLGSISGDGIVDIRNSYAVPHNESLDQVAVDIDYHRTMFDLHQRVNPKEVIIGCDDRPSIKAYVSTNLTLGDRQLAAQFQEIQLDLRMIEAERIGFDVLKKTMVDKLPNDIEGLEGTISRLHGMIDTVYRYVDDVVEGRIPPDNTIGRYLADTMAAVPKIAPDAFDKLFNDSVQDVLLVIYLANLTRTQLTLAEKLNTAAQIV
ncbi:hypothetical protein R1sor_002451 [Riccia sorocarpa]|uniref:MPN domain-containing protein n=1 Tax=Riccia sorocarpa TaxID=122646 RepID=A0ABD3H2T5_9MARC